VTDEKKLELGELEFTAGDCDPHRGEYIHINDANALLRERLSRAVKLDGHREDGGLPRAWWLTNQTPFGHTPTHEARLVAIRKLGEG
jgi:hypothetical protein